MPYIKPTPTEFKPIKGQVNSYKGKIEEVLAFYNNFNYKIKASNIFPEIANGSNTGQYTIIVFYDK